MQILGENGENFYFAWIVTQANYYVIYFLIYLFLFQNIVLLKKKNELSSSYECQQIFFMWGFFQNLFP